MNYRYCNNFILMLWNLWHELFAKFKLIILIFYNIFAWNAQIKSENCNRSCIFLYSNKWRIKLSQQQQQCETRNNKTRNNKIETNRKPTSEFIRIWYTTISETNISQYFINDYNTLDCSLSQQNKKNLANIAPSPSMNAYNVCLLCV